jgi:hypothetical protein
MDWTSVIQTVLITLVIATLFGFVLKFWFEQMLSRDLERFKAELQRTHDLDLERFRADLRLVAFEHQARLAKLDEKRAEVIAELYKRLVRTQDRVKSIGSIVAGQDGSSVQQRTELAAQESDALREYFDENRLYFDEGTCIQIDHLLNILEDTFVDFKLAASNPKSHRERWEAAQRTMYVNVPEIRQVIEKDFRVMLGYRIEQEDRVGIGDFQVR